MASPHVAGVAALLWSKNPSVKNQNIRDLIDFSATQLGDEYLYGNGIVDVSKSLENYDQYILKDKQNNVKKNKNKNQNTGTNNNTQSNYSITSTSYEAESSSNTFNGTSIVNDSNCSSGKYVGNVGSFRFNNISIASTGIYNLKIYYKTGENRSALMSVNSGANTQINFPNVGNWTSVGVYTTQINLTNLNNTISFCNGSSWAPDFDRITIEYVSALPPSTSTISTYEAESTANTLYYSSIVNDASFSGGQYVGWVGWGRTLQFNNIIVSTTGNYNMTIFYRCGENRGAYYSVNSGPQIPINFPSLGNWNTIGSITIPINLTALNNTIKFGNDSGWAPDFDKIDIISQETGNPEWYNMDVVVDDGSVQHIYINDVASNETNTNVIAIVSNNNEAFKTYTISNGNWTNSPISYTPPTGGSVNYCGLFDANNVQIEGFIDDLKIAIRDKLLSSINISASDIELDELDAIKDGALFSLDDNFLHGILCWLGKAHAHYDDFYFMCGKIGVDVGAITFYTTISEASTAASDALIASAAIEAVAGAMVASTGVGVLPAAGAEALALSSITASRIFRVTKLVAVKGEVRSNIILEKDKIRINSLPVNNAGNFRANLINYVGNAPSDMIEPRAHHVLPQQFITFFKGKGIDVHDPKYGVWLSSSTHSYVHGTLKFNDNWNVWISDHSGASETEILVQARIFASNCGFSVNF